MDVIRAAKPLGQPLLESGTVDVWSLSLASAHSFPADVLAPEERQRAARFHFDRDRNRFVQCRLWLRNVLGQYLGIGAGQVPIEYGERGKPFVAKGHNARNLQFNLAHSGDYAVLAMTVANRLGVDIEQIERLRDHVHIAQRYFSDREAGELMSLPEGLRREGFEACWTRKEAFIKAVGAGLSLPLSDFSVTVHPANVPEIVELPADFRDAKWWLSDLPAPAGYRAALVVEGGPCRLRAFPDPDGIRHRG
jgi:4'-phosphopantetheinyl transferase